ncbi:Aste57867_13192 [Aphanomyces stellatus]|uniref:Aste57867_13192 protein n=1 Tax=Aphanomyces stellatus TaxID=120398 RepID=A0A485KXI0_9STRA|nr:hypothetical protein As57867_013143 [Aphanomyces stellatus]VFT90033.1 Aste57867_13192 [Aphanomyces stellatus]
MRRSATVDHECSSFLCNLQLDSACRATERRILFAILRRRGVRVKRLGQFPPIRDEYVFPHRSFQQIPTTHIRSRPRPVVGCRQAMFFKAASSIPSASTKQLKLLSKFVHAVDCNRRLKATWLLWRGANGCINQLNEDGYSALHIACRRGHSSMVNMLLRQGADIHLMSMEEEGNVQPLHLAVAGGRADIVFSLLMHNVNVNCLTENHETALHLAVRHNHAEIVDLLLKHDAREDIPDLNGKIAFQVAVEIENAAVLQVFVANLRLHRRTPKKSQYFK